MSRRHQRLAIAFLTICLAAPAMEAHAQKPTKRPQKSTVRPAPTRAQLDAALVTAVGKRSFDRVQDLLRRGANPNAASEGSPLLVLAASSRLFADSVPGSSPGDTAAALLAAGAKPDAADRKGTTALRLSALTANNTLCELLLAYHASVDLADRDGTTPLMAAADRNHLHIMEVLLAHHANPNARNKDGLTPLAYSVMSKEENLIARLLPERYSGIARHPAFQRLMAAGADLKAKTNDGTGLLALAATVGNIDIIRVLFKNGADVNEQSPPKGDTPLLLAVLEGKGPTIHFLLANGADPNFATKEGLTPLMAAVHNGNFAIVQMLLNKKAAVSAKTNDGHTALKIAEEQKLTALVQLLTAAGATE